MRSALLCRGAALVAASALSVTTLGVLSSPAEAHPAGDRAVNAGATWLKAQLKDGLLVGPFGPSYGPSIDAGLAFAETGQASGLASVNTALRAGINSYISGGEFDPGSTYAGATGKAAAFAAVAGEDPRAYGGVNLISRLEDRVSATGPIAGRIEDASTYGDYANVISQGWAARALTTAGSAKAAAATKFLLAQQCPEGFFRAGLTADKTSPEQGCVSGAAGSGPSVDTTSLTVINLLKTPGVSATTAALARAGADWLKTQQAPDGSFSAGGDEGYNTNSTGLAAWALDLAGKDAAATKAASWLRGVQIADLVPCATTLSVDNGALAPNPAALEGARTAKSIPAAQRFTYAFATAQAMPALARVPAGTGPLAVSAPATAVEKSTVDVIVSGLGAGEAGCVSFGSVSKPVTGTAGNVTVTFALPAGAASHTFTLATLAGTLTATTRATLTPTPEVGTLDTGKVETVKNNRFKVSLTCDDTEWCNGKVVVRTARKIVVGDAARARKVLVAKTSYSVAPGTSKTLVIKVRKPARPALTEGRVQVKAVQSASDADRAVTKFWLRAK